LTVIDFPDTNSLQDALTTGAIHAAGGFDGPQLAALGAVSGVQTVPSHTGSITPFTMRVDQPPFNDFRVRQALRLLVDRPQLIDSALDGYGVVASDVFSPYDPDFDSGLRREQDIPAAKALLKTAGQENLTVKLVTAPAATGMVAMATVLAEQALAAGVTIHLDNVPTSTFFGKNYLSWSFSQDFYSYDPYLMQVSTSMLPASPFNETHTDSPILNNLYNAANSTLVPSVRKEILYEMQTYDFNKGAYIIPAYIDSLDAYSTKITGYSSCATGVPLSNFDFEKWSFV
jgi:peptide/nickel transport system substrate-binding protein